MAAMANAIEVFKGSYESKGIAHEKWTWVVWIGGQDHTVRSFHRLRAYHLCC